MRFISKIGKNMTALSTRVTCKLEFYDYWVASPF